MKTFTLNGNQVFEKEINYNMICDFEDCGVSIGDIQKKSLSFIRAYIASCLGVTSEEAGLEIQEHLLGGGTLTELTDAVGEALNESGFFQALSQRTEKTSQTSKKSRKTTEV